MQGSYYRHSGRAPLGGIFTALFFGLVGAMICAFAMNLMTQLAHFSLLRVLLVPLAGVGAGYVAMLGARLGKMRHNGLLRMLGLVTGLMLAYTHWVAWFALESGTLTLAPGALWSMLPKGNLLYLLCGLEALGLWVVPVIAVSRLIDKPFCEHCAHWIKGETELGPYRFIAHPQKLKEAMESGQYEALRQLEATVEGSSMYSVVRITRCQDCEHSFLLSVDNVSVRTDRDGKESTSSLCLIDHCVIPPGVFRQLAA